MIWRFAADVVLLVHFLVIVFIVGGGFLARRYQRLAVPHLAIALYGVVIEAIGFRCPLTPLEKSLRSAAGEAGYEGGFIEHYIVRIIYPGGLDAIMRTSLIALLVLLSVVAYWPTLMALVHRSGFARPASERLQRPAHLPDL